MARIKLSLRSKLVILLCAVSSAFIAAGIGYGFYSQTKQTEQEMLESARIMAAEMSASWEFVDMNQARIDTDRDGVYNFKGIYCAVAGRGISNIFMSKTDYVLRYVSLTPRNPIALADSFESDSLSRFLEGAQEHYGLESYEGNPSFRYTAPIYFKESCLSCHGDPAGELDVTGHEKEGAEVGDLAGAISIVIPSDVYMSSMHDNIASQVAFSAASTLAIALIIFFAFERLVASPLGEIGGAMKDLKSGLFLRGKELRSAKRDDEIGRMAREFMEMASQLESVQGQLESQVYDRTKELARANALLEDQRARLERMNGALAQEVKFKTDFLAIMGHELKTPLTAILAYAEILETGDVGDCRQDKDSIRELKANGQILLYMINNILDAARSDAGKMHLNREYVDVSDVVRATVNRLSVLAARREIDLVVEMDPSVDFIRADGDKVRRILENLISNAIKYGDKSGHVFVRVSKSSSKGISIEVTDNGPGIEEDLLDKVFDRFARSAKSSTSGGSGLGLNVVKDLAELHGGSVSVTSERGVGSTFTVVLPRGFDSEDGLEIGSKGDSE